VTTDYFLGEEEIQIWRVQVDNSRWESCEDLLTDEELHKAGTFATAQLRRRYRHYRAALRLILSRYTGASPRELTLVRDRLGKPLALARTLNYNVSHSQTLALVALSRDTVGVDVEHVNFSFDISNVVESVCAPVEQRRLKHLPFLQRHWEFYRIWTRKEAYTKALGVGIGGSLGAITFREIRGGGIFRVCDEQRDLDAGFYVHALSVDPKYAAAVCGTSPDNRISVQTAWP
jgi:4'-phosphopantetheinyl transferase